MVIGSSEVWKFILWFHSVSQHIEFQQQLKLMEYLQAPTNNIYYQAGNDNRKVTLADGVECYNRREEEWSPLGRESDERRHSRRNFKHMLVAKAIQMRQPAKTSRNRRTNLFSRNMYSFVFLFFLFPRKPLILTWKMSEKVFLLCPIKEEGRQLIYKTFQKKKKGNYKYFFNNLHFLYVFFFLLCLCRNIMPKCQKYQNIQV